MCVKHLPSVSRVAAIRSALVRPGCGCGKRSETDLEVCQMENGGGRDTATQERKREFPWHNNVAQRKTILNELSGNTNF